MFASRVFCLTADIQTARPWIFRFCRPPGRPRLATRPRLTGPLATMKTIGIVVVGLAIDNFSIAVQICAHKFAPKSRIRVESGGKA
jgi:hypothetical protein